MSKRLQAANWLGINRLWLKLMGAFAFVTIVSLVVTVVLTRQGTATQFEHLMVQHHMIRPERFQEVLVDYYHAQGGWNDLGKQLPILVQLASDGTMGTVMGGMMGMYENRIQVSDLTGMIVADTAEFAEVPFSSDQSVQQWPITADGQTVGFFIVEGAMMVGSPDRNDLLMVGVTRAVLLAGLVAGFVGLLLSGLLVRQLTRPLSVLTTASRRIAAGDLRVQIPLQGQDDLGELAITFNQMASNLQTQEELRHNLIADIAHELRTPLAGVQGTIEALQDGIFPATSENLQAIHEQVLLLNNLVEDLRTLATADAGQLVLTRTPLDLAALCQRQLTLFQAQALAKQIELTFQSDGASPTICADEQRLGQVLNNLLDNALRHTPAGGAITLRFVPFPKTVRLAVIDTGEGIQPSDLPAVFDRFYRADRSRNRQTGGSGLGLAIARQLVLAHGGQLWVESPPANQTRGSAFTVDLPLC